jgi:hypothetical protein
MEYSSTEMDEVCEDWIQLITLVLGSPRDAATEWAREHVRPAMDNPLFLHETTSWYILPLIITDEVRRKSRSMGELESKLDLALERFRQKMSGQVSAEQIDAIRGEIRGIIEANVASLEP